jgi:hypothetical protein
VSDINDFDTLAGIMNRRFAEAEKEMASFTENATPEEKAKIAAEFEEVKKLTNRARSGMVEVNKKMGEYGS